MYVVLAKPTEGNATFAEPKAALPPKGVGSDSCLWTILRGGRLLFGCIAPIPLGPFAGAAA